MKKMAENGRNVNLVKIGPKSLRDGALNHATCTVHFRYVTNKSDRNNTVCVDEVMWCLQ